MNTSYFDFVSVFILVYRGKQTSALVLVRFMQCEAIWKYLLTATILSNVLTCQLSWLLHLSCQIRPKSSTPTSCSYSVCPISKAPFGSNLLSSWFALISLILISCFLLLHYFFSFKIGLLAFILCIPGLGVLYIHNSNFYSLELFPFHYFWHSST